MLEATDPVSSSKNFSSSAFSSADGPPAGVSGESPEAGAASLAAAVLAPSVSSESEALG